MTITHDSYGGESDFIRMRDSHTHSWKAVFTKWYSMRGRRKMVAWVSERQIDCIVEQHPSTKI
jgi:hypothetical protein